MVIRKNKLCFTVKSNLNIKNLNKYFNKKSDFILYNISRKFYKYLNQRLFAWLLIAKAIVDKGKPKFL